ncbi:hypothetical protein Verru16b_02671 [Lacunisphaera limnophila]|uniref:Uncharacterized protein n=2 Tax=Lacunisphaera limnophila TaxID=1838286 RepID=A0A1D8AXH5_9BACT|nr:hypothetical protein Verru16b_02671 [Lacunisphaera limnophila]
MNRPHHRLANGLARVGLLVLTCLGANALIQAAAPASSASAVFTDSSAAGLAGTKRVAITSVLVSFQASTSNRTDTNGILANKSDTEAKMVWPTMDPAELGAITDEIYAQLRTDLAAHGFEVVPEATVLASPTYQQIVKLAAFSNFSKYGNMEGDVMLVEASSLKPYVPFSLEVGTFPYPFKGVIKGWSSKDTGGLTANSTYYTADLPKLEVALAKELNAHVVKATYLVTLGSAKAGTSGRMFRAGSAHSGSSVTNTHTAEIFPQVGIRATHTRIAFRTPTGKPKGQTTSRAKPVPAKDGDVVVTLAQPLLGATDLFSFTSASQGKGVWGLAPGADMKFTFTATLTDPKAYHDEVVAMAKAAQEDLLALVQQ